MKTLSSVLLIVSLFVLPCVLNLENLWCCLAVLASGIGSFLLFKKHNSEFINH